MEIFHDQGEDLIKQVGMKGPEWLKDKIWQLEPMLTITCTLAAIVGGFLQSVLIIQTCCTMRIVSTTLAMIWMEVRVVGELNGNVEHGDLPRSI